MATVSPTSASCPAEPHTGQGAYLKFEITSVSDSDAATNKRYVGWKITFQGTPWVQLFKAYATLGGSVIYDGEPGTTGWSVGTILASNTTTFDNDSAGNLTLAFYMKQLFYYGTWSWNNSGYAQEKNETFRFSQLPRYAAFTSHTATPELNKITVSYTADVEYKAQQYSLNGGAWTNTTAGSYNLTGLTPNTSYTIKTKIQRADSNLWTESDTITIKTKALPTSIAPSDILFNKDGNTFTPSISSVDYLSGWYVIVKDGSTQVRSYSGTQSTTASKTYTLQGSDFTSMLPRHTTTDNWNLTVQYNVISNGTTYTLTDRTFKCTIPAGQYLPVYNANNLSYVVTDSKTLELNNNNATKVIKGISSVEITSTAASPQGSASMSSYIASSGTKQKSGTTTTAPIKISLDNVDGPSFSVQAVDSRNRSTTVTKDYAAFIDYFAPIVDSANITRVDAIGTNININIVGRYMNWSGLATSNTIEQVSIKYRIKGATSWTTKTGITFTRSVGNGNFTITGVITGNNFVATNEYELQLTFKDKIGDFIVLANIPVGDSLLWRDLANKRIGIGKKPDEALDVAGNAKVSGNATIGGTINVNGKDLDEYLNKNEMTVLSDTSNKWRRICNIKFIAHNQGEFVRLKIYIGDGNNGEPSQNAYIDLFGQLGWTGSFEGRMGVLAELHPFYTSFTISNTHVKVIANSNIDYDVWLKTDSSYYCRPNVIGSVSNNATLDYSDVWQDDEPIGTECNLSYKTYQPSILDEIYSTEEQRVGTWIDGKPIYRKILADIQLLNNPGTQNIQHDINNIDNVINLKGFMKNSLESIPIQSVYRPVPNSQYFDIGLLINDTNITLTYCTDRSSYKAYIIIEYTKTTD